jgi:hypothetical protein
MIDVLRKEEVIRSDLVIVWLMVALAAGALCPLQSLLCRRLCREMCSRNFGSGTRSQTLM